MDRTHFAVSTMIAQRNRGLKAYCRKMEENCEALEGADALLLLSEWALFRRLDFPRMKDLLKTPLIFDGRHTYSPPTMKSWGSSACASDDVEVLPENAERESCFSGRTWGAWRSSCEDCRNVTLAVKVFLNYNVIQTKRGGDFMAANSLVQARIDPEVKKEASVVLASMGLSVSDAVRLMLVRVAAEKALPFDPLIPNETTLAAMREARAGGLPSAGSVGELMDALNAED